ncbi:hypothetical protein Tco_0424051 [Tanacetum coccineum]
MPIPNVVDEAIFKERDDRVVRDTTTAASLDAVQASGNITKTQSTTMSNDLLSQEISSGDRPRCQEAMRGAIAQTRSEKASKHSYDSPLLGVNTPGSYEERIEQQDLTDFVPPTPYDSPLSGGHTPGNDEGRPNINALMDICTNLSNRVLALDEALQDCNFDLLNDAMENVEGSSTAEQTTTAGDTLNTASINVSATGPSTRTTRDIFKDQMTTIADTVIAIRSARPRTTSVVIRNVEEEPRGATPVPTVQSQDKEEQAQFEREQRIARERAAEQEAKDAALIEKKMEDARFLVETIAARKKFFGAQRAAEIINRPPTKTELRNHMITYLKHMGKYTHNQLKSKSFEEIQKLYKKEQQWINDFVPISDDSGKKNDSSSKQAESIQADDIAIDVQSLASKYPLVDWKTHILTKNMMYYQIIKADGSSKNYKIFSEMLDDFDRQDVMDLHRLVKERYDTTSPEGYDLLLWGDLKTLFEPCEEDEVWRNQQGYNLISWRLFDSCGVHVLLMDNGISIHMMIENKYPLTQEMLLRMLNRRLEVDHESEMAFELLRFTRSQLKK